MPDRPLCIQKHALPHGLCLYLCPYADYLIPSYADSLDLSNISDLEDIMIMSSDKGIPALDDVPNWKDWFDLNITLNLNLLC